MQSYNDVQTLDQITREEFEAGGADLARAFDVREADLASEDWELWLAGASNEPAITVLWMPRIGRAGLVHGGDAVWTDADSVQDAIERLLGDEGKEIDN